MRAVFDTNVLISALLFENSTPAHAFFAALKQGEVLLSATLADEINRILYQFPFSALPSVVCARGGSPRGMGEHHRTVLPQRSNLLEPGIAPRRLAQNDKFLIDLPILIYANGF